MKNNRHLYIKKALRLEYFTVIYNALEACASLAFGFSANSIALIGFGLDSIVESLSALVLIWRLKKHNKVSAAEEERIEKKAVRLVGMSFFVLAAYVLFESARKLALADTPDPSMPGIIIALLSLIVMPVLGIKKLKIGKKCNLPSLVADSKETFVCSFLSFALLLGLGSNYLFGFWQADPITGLIITLYLINEGRELLFDTD